MRKYPWAALFVPTFPSVLSALLRQLQVATPFTGSHTFLPWGKQQIVEDSIIVCVCVEGGIEINGEISNNSIRNEEKTLCFANSMFLSQR